MASEVTKLTLPQARYIPIFLGDGHHSGVEYDPARGIIQIQRRGKKEWFDLATLAPVECAEKTCYTKTR